MTYYELYCQDKSAMASAISGTCPFAKCPNPDKKCDQCSIERLDWEVPAGMVPKKEGATKENGQQGISHLIAYLANNELDGRDAYMATCGWLACGGEDSILCSKEEIRELLRCIADYENDI